MSCNCEGSESQCIKAYVGPCDEGIAIGLTAPVDGDYLVLLEGGGAARRFVLEMEQGAEIVLENTINNSFTYSLQIFKPSGDLLNDTCYTLKTIVTIGNDTPVPPPSSIVRTRECTIEAIIVDDPDPTNLYTLCNGNKIRYEYAPGNTLQILDEDGLPYLPGLYIQRPIYLADGVFQTMPYNSTLGTFDNSENGGFMPSGDANKPTVFTLNYAQPI